MRLLGVLAAAALLIAPVVSGPAAEAASARTTYVNQAFSATNTHRVKHDRDRFAKGSCVQRYAQRQADRMAREQEMYHQDLGPILRACDLNTVGENVAYGYRSGKEVVAGWMNSEGHRANILNADFTVIGIGAARSRDGRWYAAQVFGGRG